MSADELAHKRHTKILLGERAYVQPGVQDAAVTRQGFPITIEEEAPSVLVAIKRKTFPRYRAEHKAWLVKHPDRGRLFFDWPEQLDETVCEWADDFNLLLNGKPPNWIKEQVEYTCTIWEQTGPGKTWRILRPVFFDDPLERASWFIQFPSYSWCPARPARGGLRSRCIEVRNGIVVNARPVDGCRRRRLHIRSEVGQNSLNTIGTIRKEPQRPDFQGPAQVLLTSRRQADFNGVIWYLSRLSSS